MTTEESLSGSFREWSGGRNPPDYLTPRVSFVHREIGSPFFHVILFLGVGCETGCYRLLQSQRSYLERSPRFLEQGQTLLPLGNEGQRKPSSRSVLFLEGSTGVNTDW